MFHYIPIPKILDTFQPISKDYCRVGNEDWKSTYCESTGLCSGGPK